MEVKSTRQFRKRLADTLDYASINFGQKTVRNWQVCLEKMLNALRSNPERYPFALEIRDVQPNAHGVIMMKNFKVIFVYNPRKQIVYLADIWDMRQDPNVLRNSWKIIRI